MEFGTDAISESEASVTSCIFAGSSLTYKPKQSPDSSIFCGTNNSSAYAVADKNGKNMKDNTVRNIQFMTTKKGVAFKEKN